MRKDIRTTAMGVSLAVAFLMLLGKLVAYAITGSAAILSDAAESIVHIVATGIAAFSLWYARQPADRQHLYGHGRIAYFSAGFEGALIFSAALFIFYVSVRSLILGPELRQLGLGILITAGLAIVNLALGMFLIRTGQKRNALILVANGKHIMADMWSSAGVVVGVGVVRVTQLIWLDPLVAMLVALNIVYSGGSLVRRALQGLLDQADPGKTHLLVDCLQEATRSGLLSGFHQLRHRQTNDVLWVEVHVLLPGNTSMRTAHNRVTQVENVIRNRSSGFTVYMTTHIEPEHHDRAHPEGHPGQHDPLRADADRSRDVPQVPAPSKPAGESRLPNC